ncbi:helix-turn-helix domain-containing protein [Rhodococcus opacus]|uniref:Transcriptional regulator n=1 Tax=Rhodococcus opacus TaxID=37919 RepID=A0A076F2C1_RHOOP|nr:helix-turn-helix transcriptional regulator [Rhodococcus opacus]AII11482.1 transcriptional regulator [Rhodococcus opacus]
MTQADTGARIDRAMKAAGLSQRTLGAMTGISQSTLSRIIAGDRPAKMNELLAISTATGSTVAELTGTSVVAGRVQCAARSANGSNMEQMREKLLHFLELDAYLDEQGIPAVP